MSIHVLVWLYPTLIEFRMSPAILNITSKSANVTARFGDLLGISYDRRVHMRQNSVSFCSERRQGNLDACNLGTGIGDYPGDLRWRRLLKGTRALSRTVQKIIDRHRPAPGVE